VLFFDGGFGLIMFALWLFCIIDVITTDESRIRHLPKLLWLLIVLLIPDVGSIVWLVAGHTWESRVPPTGVQRDFPEYDRPGRHIATNPDDDEAFLRQLRARAEEQRQRGDQERRAREEREARKDQGLEEAGPQG
jgi:Phospholipase_D-nuclease N-terminal